MEKPKKFYGWKLVGVLWVLYLLNMGFPLYGGAVINSFLLKEIPMDRATYGLGFSLLNLCVGLSAILVGITITKWGIRKTFMIGSGLLIIGALMLSLVASRPWHYLVGFGVLIGAGIGFCTIVALSTAITRWFVKFRGRAMAVAMTASGFAGFIGAPAMNQLIATTGGNWRSAWIVVAVIALISGGVAYFFVKERPQDLGQIPDGQEAGVASNVNSSINALITQYPWTPAEVYKSVTYWLAVIAAAASQWPFFFFTAHWILHLRGAGINPADAAFAMGLFTMGGIFGRLISGWLMDRMAARYVMMLGICCYFLGSYLAILASPSTLAAAYIAAICYGAGFGWAFVAQNTMLGNFFGPAAFPKVNGTLQAISALVVSCSGVVGGQLFDMYKSYTPAFQLNSIICVIGIIVLVFAKIPQPKNLKEMPSIKT
ncbi:MFS family permease [Sporomusaceae bacterium BoRhaA]|uniref:MFS transporter n=1 Tax=Pelorhabdus rhamnosifermentans TaxID=2772457 RepID=UPI001C06119B|nr:MFS transporter [Pelorhabdus rhamnosifermentans]MBU2700975.1 MFS family permease [Pelorhabdus rhamnosifermentans]